MTAEIATGRIALVAPAAGPDVADWFVMSPVRRAGARCEPIFRGLAACEKAPRAKFGEETHHAHDIMKVCGTCTKASPSTLV